MGIQINIIAVLAAAVASMVVGFIYYSPIVLGKPWMKLMGTTDMKPKGSEMAKTYGISFVLSIIMAFVLYHVMTMSTAYFGYSGIMTGLMSGFWMWIGFIVPVMATDVLFGKKSFKLYGINVGYQLVSLLVMGVVIGLIG